MVGIVASVAVFCVTVVFLKLAFRELFSGTNTFGFMNLCQVFLVLFRLCSCEIVWLCSPESRRNIFLTSLFLGSLSCLNLCRRCSRFSVSLSLSLSLFLSFERETQASRTHTHTHTRASPRSFYLVCFLFLGRLTVGCFFVCVFLRGVRRCTHSSGSSRCRTNQKTPSV